MLVTASSPAESVVFDWAFVGNAGNAPDPKTGKGAVAYDFAISKTEVTNRQYAAFLNAVDSTGANRLGLYKPLMAGFHGGIAANGLTDGGRYTLVAGRERNPVNFVSFFDAMRFVNWLHNGQGSAGTETGVYEVGDGISETRLPCARFWLPNENEWYKAAYHDASSGTADAYFDYATGSNTRPFSDQPEGMQVAANYFHSDRLRTPYDDGFAVSGRDDVFPTTTNPLTDVGAYKRSISPYGTFDQNGNVAEWIEDLVRAPSIRGA